MLHLREAIRRLELEAERLRREIAELRADKERLETANAHLGKLAADRYDRILELEREIVNERSFHSWTQAREQMAYDALRKEHGK